MSSTTQQEIVSLGERFGSKILQVGGVQELLGSVGGPNLATSYLGNIVVWNQLPESVRKGSRRLALQGYEEEACPFGSGDGSLKRYWIQLLSESVSPTFFFSPSFKMAAGVLTFRRICLRWRVVCLPIRSGSRLGVGI